MFETMYTKIVYDDEKIDITLGNIVNINLKDMPSAMINRDLMENNKMLSQMEVKTIQYVKDREIV